MASEREIVSLTPPSFLTTLDWNNSHHKRSVAASLVQGVYTLEHDRRKGRNGPQSLAPPWWRSYNFKLVQILVDSHDDSHSGAVYEYLDFRRHLNTNQRPPRYVIAFRGTISKTGNWKQDFKLNLNLIINNLHNRSRFRIGIDAVRGFVRQAGPANVWIAGHSLGASLALLAGREMAKYDGVHLEAYLFNPPFPSLPIQRLANNKLSLGLRLANSVLTAGLAAAVRNKIKEKRMIISAYCLRGPRTCSSIRRIRSVRSIAVTSSIGRIWRRSEQGGSGGSRRSIRFGAFCCLLQGRSVKQRISFRLLI